MIARILHRLGLVKGVWLQSYNGELYLTWIHKNTPFGHMCYVYPVAKIGQVLLNEDGTTDGESVYIKKWKYME